MSADTSAPVVRRTTYDTVVRERDAALAKATEVRREVRSAALPTRLRSGAAQAVGSITAAATRGALGRERSGVALAGAAVVGAATAWWTGQPDLFSFALGIGDRLLGDAVEDRAATWRESREVDADKRPDLKVAQG